MAKRIDYEAVVGQVYTNKKRQRYEVLAYNFNEGKHTYDVQFIDDKGKPIYSIKRGMKEYHLYNESYLVVVKNQSCKDRIQDSFDKKKANRAYLNKRYGSKKSVESYERVADLRNKTVLAIDGATYTTGIALYKKGNIYTKEVYVTGSSPVERIASMQRTIERVLDLQKVDVVYYEEPLLRNKNATFTLGTMFTNIKNSVIKRGIKFIKITPSSWQSYQGFKGEREERKEASKARASRLMGRPMGEDESDAYNLLDYALNKLELKEVG